MKCPTCCLQSAMTAEDPSSGAISRKCFKIEVTSLLDTGHLNKNAKASKAPSRRETFHVFKFHSTQKRSESILEEKLWQLLFLTAAYSFSCVHRVDDLAGIMEGPLGVVEGPLGVVSVGSPCQQVFLSEGKHIAQACYSKQDSIG